MVRNGNKTILHIGVAKDSHAQFEAHAWLILGGNIFLGKLEDIDRFKELSDIWAGVQ
jgi:hypothetical protein